MKTNTEIFKFIYDKLVSDHGINPELYYMKFFLDAIQISNIIEEALNLSRQLNAKYERHIELLEQINTLNVQIISNLKNSLEAVTGLENNHYTTIEKMKSIIEEYKKSGING